MLRDRKALVAVVLVFAAVAAAATSSSSAKTTSHRGGTLKLLAKAAGGTLDPQVNYTLRVLAALPGDVRRPARLQEGRRRRGVQRRARPRVGLPKPTNGGKTWIFKLRKGIKFSNGQALTVNDVVASFQRIFKVKSPTAGGFYAGIVGAAACLKTPATCTLKGGVDRQREGEHGDDQPDRARRRVQVQARRPARVDPPGERAAERRGHEADPGTGAYYFTSYDPNKQLVMKRNPYFKEWSKDAQPDGYPGPDHAVVRADGRGRRSRAIENGQADWTLEAPPADRLNEIGTKYASQVHVKTLTAFWYAPMNVNLPPFNNLKARQAVNYAIDRNAAGQDLRRPEARGARRARCCRRASRATSDYCPYTKNPGTTVVGARPGEGEGSSSRSPGTAGQKVTVISPDDEVNKAMGVYLQSVLN